MHTMHVPGIEKKIALIITNVSGSHPVFLCQLDYMDPDALCLKKAHSDHSSADKGHQLRSTISTQPT